MRSRFLISAAIFMAGLAVASAQTAPGGAGQERNQIRRRAASDVGHQAHGRSNRAPDAAFGAVAPGLDNLRRKQHGTATRDTASSRPRGRSDLISPAKHNDASVLAPRGQSERGKRERHDGMASDRSILDRAIAQGRLRSERNRIGQDEHKNYDRSGLDHPTRPGHRQTAMPRHLPDQGMGSASARELAQARGQAGEQELSKARGQGGGKARRQARNHRREQAHGQARSHAHEQTHSARSHPDSQRGQDEIRKVQAALNQQGFNVGDPDGKLGKRTKEALTAFQKQRGFKATGKVDHATLDALLASGAAAPGAGPENNQPNRATPAQAAPAQAAPEQAAPQAVPLGVPAEPGTTGQGNAQPAMPPTERAPETPQMPDNDASGRVPAASPQENYKEDTVPGGDQR